MAIRLADNTEFVDLDVGNLGDFAHGKPKKEDHGGYRKAINCLRMRAGEKDKVVSTKINVRARDGSISWQEYHCPALPLEDNINIRFVEVRLHARLSDENGTQANVTLIIRRDNLYLVGYLLEVGERNGDSPLLDAWTLNSSILSGTPRSQEAYPVYQEIQIRGDNPENYEAILFNAFGRQEGNAYQNILLGRQALTDAVTMLVDHESRPEFINVPLLQRQTRALLTFCFMFCEAARLNPVLALTVMGWGEHPTHVEYWVPDLVHSWGQASRDVLQDDDACKPWEPRRYKIKKKILLEIDPTMAKDIEEYAKTLEDPSRAFDENGKPKPDKPRVVGFTESDAIEVEIRTAAEMTAYIGVLFMGSLQIEKLKTKTIKKKIKN